MAIPGPGPDPPPVTWRERLVAMRRSIPTVLIVLGVLALLTWYGSLDATPPRRQLPATWTPGCPELTASWVEPPAPRGFIWADLFPVQRLNDNLLMLNAEATQSFNGSGPMPKFRTSLVSCDGRVLATGPVFPAFSASPRKLIDGLLWYAYADDTLQELHLLGLNTTTLAIVHEAVFPPHGKGRLSNINRSIRYRVALGTGTGGRIPVVATIERFSGKNRTQAFLLIWNPATKDFDAPVRLVETPDRGDIHLTDDDRLVREPSKWDGKPGQAFDIHTGAVLAAPPAIPEEKPIYAECHTTRLSPVPHGWIATDPRPIQLITPDLKLSPEILFPRSYRDHPDSLASQLRDGWFALHPATPPFNARIDYAAYERDSARLSKPLRVQSVILSDRKGTGAHALGGDLAETLEATARPTWEDFSGSDSEPKGLIRVGKYGLAGFGTGLSLQRIDETQALVIQIVSPTPAAINRRKGIIRFGLVNAQSKEVDWRGWVPLPTANPWRYSMTEVGPTNVPGEWYLMLDGSEAPDGSDGHLWFLRFPAPTGITLPVSDDDRIGWKMLVGLE